MKKIIVFTTLILSFAAIYANGQNEDVSNDRPQREDKPPMMEMSFDNAEWMDVHGAGAQRSDPKSGSLDEYSSADNGYYHSIAPQGDAIRINNYVRLVRETEINGNSPVVGTNQTIFYDDKVEIEAPVSPDQDWYGQDAQHNGKTIQYTISDDGFTVLDEVTGLTWMRGPNKDLSEPKASDKLTLEESVDYVKELNESNYGGYSDWRIPSIKEQYSLIIFSGIDVSGYECSDTSDLVPFIDNEVFNFAYGDVAANERLIDSQYLSTNKYIYDGDGELLFGVNFSDGRIKGYGTTMPGNREKTFFVQLVRGNTQYGINDFVDNGDKTVTDRASGLMWSQDDSNVGFNWKDSLSWVQKMNEESYLGYSDWRLPDAKELQSLVDYSHAPDVDGKPAIDTDYLNCTTIINENNEEDFPWYWSSTTHANYAKSGTFAVYVCFGRAMAFVPQMNEPPRR